MSSRYQIDRRLADRSKLMFYFPAVSETEDHHIVELPFFENIEIRERKKARFKRYDLISRSSNLYSYLGAESRQLDLTFHLTLPHILDDGVYLTREATISDQSTEYEKKRFQSITEPGDVVLSPAIRMTDRFLTLPGLADSVRQVLSSEWGKSLHTYPAGESIAAYIYSRFHIPPPSDSHGAIGPMAPDGITAPAPPPVVTGPLPPAVQGPGAPPPRAPTPTVEPPEPAKQRIIDIIIYWVNIIRASVTNHAEDPLHGPPIIRLSHGIMYQNVPCICRDYRIDWDDKVGYDLDTLLPRRIKVGLKLEEIRTGDFGKYSPNISLATGEPVDGASSPVDAGDNLAGWEAVIEHGTMDPGSI